MWRLYGVFDLGCVAGESVSVVAEFSQECLAHDYLSRSLLSRPRVDGGKFKVASLLSHYHDAYIEWCDCDFPVDPVFGEKD